MRLPLPSVAYGILSRIQNDGKGDHHEDGKWVPDAKPQAGPVQPGFKRIELNLHDIADLRGDKDCCIRYIMSKAIEPGQMVQRREGLVVDHGREALFKFATAEVDERSSYPANSATSGDQAGGRCEDDSRLARRSEADRSPNTTGGSQAPWLFRRRR